MKLKGKEFIHSYHIPKKVDKQGNIIREDMLVVKEKLHYENGDIVPNLLKIVNYKRPFWITKPIYQNHKQKRQWEYDNRLNKYECTQSDLPREILKKLGKNKYGKVQYRDAIKSPFVYGSDVSPGVLLKEEYAQKWGLITPLDVVYYDIEADVDTKEISIVSASRKIANGKIAIYVVINTGILDSPIDNLPHKVKKALLENLPDNLPNNFNPENLRFEFKIVDNDAKLTIEFWKMMHVWGGDILTSWGTYDIETFLIRMRTHNLDPKYILSDPSLPYEYRDFYHKKAATEIVTQSGKRTNKSFEKQWHLFRSPAKFYIMDNMAAYYFNRRGQKEVPGGYGLQNILTSILGYGKLKFEEVTDLTDGEWHKYMLKYEPIKYFAYNIWDQLGMLFLNDETTDLDITLPTLVERSLWEDYGYAGAPILDDFHFYARDNGVVLGTKVNDEDFGDGIGRDDWTITLHPWKRAPRVYDEEAIFIEGALPSNQGMLTSDLDVSAAYPNATIAARLSKMSTKRELLSIEGIDLTTLKRNVSNLITGNISHHGFMKNIFNAPGYEKLDKWLKKIKEDTPF